MVGSAKYDPVDTANLTALGADFSVLDGDVLALNLSPGSHTDWMPLHPGEWVVKYQGPWFDVMTPARYHAVYEVP